MDDDTGDLGMDRTRVGGGLGAACVGIGGSHDEFACVAFGVMRTTTQSHSEGPVCRIAYPQLAPSTAFGSRPPLPMGR